MNNLMSSRTITYLIGPSYVSQAMKPQIIIGAKNEDLLKSELQKEASLKQFTFDVRTFSSFRRNQLYLSMKTMDQKRVTVSH